MKLAKKVLTFFMIAALALITAVSYEFFVFPNRFAPAGLNGICTMIQHITGISVGYMSLIINIPLAVLVMCTVGRSVALRSMVYVVTFSLFLIALNGMDLSRFVYETANGTSKILGPLVAGIINGACYSFLVRSSACSGGIDFIAAVIHRYRPHQEFFWITFSLNLAIAISSYFVYDFEIEPVILCILYSFMSSTVSEKMMRSGRSAVRCEIVTDYPEELAEVIITKLHHTATLFPARGMYLGQDVSVLVCIINKTQVFALEELLKEHPHNFAVMSVVSRVVGNFKHIDTRGKPEIELIDKGDGKTV